MFGNKTKNEGFLKKNDACVVSSQVLVPQRRAGRRTTISFCFLSNRGPARRRARCPNRWVPRVLLDPQGFKISYVLNSFELNFSELCADGTLLPVQHLCHIVNHTDAKLVVALEILETISPKRQGRVLTVECGKLHPRPRVALRSFVEGESSFWPSREVNYACGSSFRLWYGNNSSKSLLSIRTGSFLSHTHTDAHFVEASCQSGRTQRGLSRLYFWSEDSGGFHVPLT